MTLAVETPDAMYSEKEFPESGLDDSRFLPCSDKHDANGSQLKMHCKTAFK